MSFQFIEDHAERKVAVREHVKKGLGAERGKISDSSAHKESRKLMKRGEGWRFRCFQNRRKTGIGSGRLGEIAPGRAYPFDDIERRAGNPRFGSVGPNRLYTGWEACNRVALRLLSSRERRPECGPWYGKTASWRAFPSVARRPVRRGPGAPSTPCPEAAGPASSYRHFPSSGLRPR